MLATSGEELEGRDHQTPSRHRVEGKVDGGDGRRGPKGRGRYPSKSVGVRGGAASYTSVGCTAATLSAEGWPCDGRPSAGGHAREGAGRERAGHGPSIVRRSCGQRRIRCGAPCGSQATASCRFVWQANGTAEGWRCDDQPSACGYSGGGAWAGGTLDGLRGVAMGACRCELTGVDRVLRVVTCRGGSVCQLCHVSTFRNSGGVLVKKIHIFLF